MNNLIIIAHPDKNSFCHNGIAKTIEKTLRDKKQQFYTVDLYHENNTFVFDKDKIKYT